MMVDQFEFHSVTEVKQRPDGGKQLLRIPESVLHQLNEGGRRVGLESIGCEVRFITPAQICCVTVGALTNESLVLVYRGPFLHSEHRVPANTIRTMHLETPVRLAGVRPDVMKKFAFSPEVWRIIFNRHIGVFYGVESFGHPIRPPTKDELPQRRWLAYGSSITHSNAYDGYPHHAARRMGVDLLNCGLSGSCHCDKAMADFLANRKDWDFATMELGINMRVAYTPEQFHERAKYLIHTMVEKNPDKPIAVITHYPTDVTFAANPGRPGEIEHAFDNSCRQIVADLKHPKLRVIEGGQVLDRYDGHGADLVHPGQLGNAVMAENLSRILAEWLAGLK